MSMKHLVFVLSFACAALAGCEQNHEVGSGCDDGFCPAASARDDAACTIRYRNTHTWRDYDYQPEVDFVSLCVTVELERRDDGMIDGHLVYALPDRESCADHAFLSPLSAALRERYGRGSEDNLCELKQLAVVMTEDGPMVEPGDGFYYDDFSEDAHECPGRSRIYVPPSAAPWRGVTLSYEATARYDSGGARNDELTCRPIRGTEPVGTPCLPDGQHIYDGTEAVFETRSAACGDGVCMVRELFGDTDPSCEDEEDDDSPICVPPDLVDYKAYCTCRCSGPSGAANLCTCPEEYVCKEMVPSHVSDMAGGYCVRNWPYNPPSN